MKEILLYSSIYSHTAQQFITEIEAAKDSDITIRVNTPGGDVYSAYGMIAKFGEHAKAKTVKVDGMAASAGAFLLCYADNVEALDVSRVMFHRAAFPHWIESNKDLFTEEMKAELNTVNRTLRAAMEGKFTDEKWQEVTGVSLDELFSLESRKDVWLSADQAKALGIFKKINTITPEKKAEIEALSQAVAIASFTFPQPETNNNNSPQKQTLPMTLEKLKQEHPDVYAQAVALGATQERDRVEAFMAFADYDLAGVKEGITAGTPISQKQMAEFTIKVTAANAVKSLEAGSPADTPNPVAGDSAEPTAEEVFLAETYAHLGLTK